MQKHANFMKSEEISKSRREIVNFPKQEKNVALQAKKGGIRNLQSMTKQGNQKVSWMKHKFVL